MEDFLADEIEKISKNYNFICESCHCQFSKRIKKNDEINIFKISIFVKFRLFLKISYLIIDVNHKSGIVCKNCCSKNIVAIINRDDLLHSSCYKKK